MILSAGLNRLDLLHPLPIGRSELPITIPARFSFLFAISLGLVYVLWIKIKCEQCSCLIEPEKAAPVNINMNSVLLFMVIIVFEKAMPIQIKKMPAGGHIHERG